MGFLDFIQKTQDKMTAKSNALAEKFGAAQDTLNTTDIETIIKNNFPKKEKNKPIKMSKIVEQILNTFYADYPEKPYVSNDRSAEWFERANLFPTTSIVPKEMMTRYSDGLLPGNVYMLFWLKRYTNKKVPAYFEYKYGIDFEKEKDILYQKGYLDGNSKPTTKGEEAIKQHYVVVEEHSVKREHTFETKCEQILKQKESLINNGFKEYVIIASKTCSSVCASFDEKHFSLATLEIGKNAPPFHEACSCSIAAYENQDDYNEWLDYISKGGTTKKWEKKRK